MLDTVFAIPDAVLSILSERSNSYAKACRIGARAADAFADCLNDERHLIGTGLLSKIARHFATIDCSRGVEAGFWARADELIHRASTSVCFEIRRPVPAKGTHESRASEPSKHARRGQPKTSGFFSHQAMRTTDRGANERSR
jgi:hypothetical protein